MIFVWCLLIGCVTGIVLRVIEVRHDLTKRRIEIAGSRQTPSGPSAN